MLRIDTLNKKIKSETSTKMSLYKDDGYFYFVYDDGDKMFEDHCVMVNQLNDLDLARWIEEAKDFHLKCQRIEKERGIIP